MGRGAERFAESGQGGEGEGAVGWSDGADGQGCARFGAADSAAQGVAESSGDWGWSFSQCDCGAVVEGRAGIKFPRDTGILPVRESLARARWIVSQQAES